MIQQHQELRQANKFTMARKSIGHVCELLPRSRAIPLRRLHMHGAWLLVEGILPYESRLYRSCVSNSTCYTSDKCDRKEKNKKPMLSMSRTQIQQTTNAQRLIHSRQPSLRLVNIITSGLAIPLLPDSLKNSIHTIDITNIFPLAQAW